MFGWLLTPLPSIAGRCCSAASIRRDQEQKASGATPDHFADALRGRLPLQHGLCPPLFSATMGGTHTQSTANAVKKLIFQQSSSPRGIARRRRVGGRTGAEAQSVLEWLPARCQPFSAGDGWVAGRGGGRKTTMTPRLFFKLSCPPPLPQVS